MVGSTFGVRDAKNNARQVCGRRRGGEPAVSCKNIAGGLFHVLLEQSGNDARWPEGTGPLSFSQDERYYELSVLHRYDGGDQDEGCREREPGVWMGMSDMRGSDGLPYRSTPTMAFRTQVLLGAHSGAVLLRDVVNDGRKESLC